MGQYLYSGDIRSSPGIGVGFPAVQERAYKFNHRMMVGTAMERPLDKAQALAVILVEF